MIKISIKIKDSPYDILIGQNLNFALQEFLQKNFYSSKAAIVVDQNVQKLHLNKIVEAFENINLKPLIFTFPPGENTKNFDNLEKLLDQILESKLERNDILCSLGGGVIGDLTGFAASIARRSMPYIQIPTTLLSQIDSSIGGKTGINARQGKNLIGSFYQPKIVICDTDYLTTLPEREWRAGYAEMLKYALINQEDFFLFLEQNYKNLKTEQTLLEKAIQISCLSKAKIVEKDEKEKGERALLNLGHTFGHAFEAFYNYNNHFIIHGEAVALGMMLAFEFSAFLNLCNDSDVLRVKQHLKKVGLPTKISDFINPPQKAEDIFNLMQQDKKTTKGEMNLILVHAIGKAFIAKNIDQKILMEFLRKKINACVF